MLKCCSHPAMGLARPMGHREGHDLVQPRYPSHCPLLPAPGFHTLPPTERKSRAELTPADLLLNFCSWCLMPPITMHKPWEETEDVLSLPSSWVIVSQVP